VLSGANDPGKRRVVEPLKERAPGKIPSLKSISSGPTQKTRLPLDRCRTFSATRAASVMCRSVSALIEQGRRRPHLEALLQGTRCGFRDPVGVVPPDLDRGAVEARVDDLELVSDDFLGRPWTRGDSQPPSGPDIVGNALPIHGARRISRSVA
jgi:hypothetical protein